MLENELKKIIRDVPDFPKEGIVFKDITPILSDAVLCKKIVAELVSHAIESKAEVIAGIEARGFLFGLLVAQELSLPFVPLRKAGKLPYKSYRASYKLEYGEASLEMHEDAFEKGKRVLIHDDLLATGGTAKAAAKLIENLGTVAGFSFLIDLEFLCGAKQLNAITPNVFSLIKY
jgi:adenine phosphoribosyltransferase